MFTHLKSAIKSENTGAFLLGATCVAVPGGIYYHHEHKGWKEKATNAFKSGFEKGEANAKSEAEKAIAEIKAAMQKVTDEAQTSITEAYNNGIQKGAADATAQIKGQIIVALTQQYKAAGMSDADATAQALAQANAMFPGT